MVALSIALYVVAAALLAFGILKGIKNGIIGQSLRLAVNLLSALTALLVGSGLLKAIANAFAGNDLAATVSGFGVELDSKMIGVISSIDPSTVSSIASVPVALLVVPILTIMVYIIVKLLLGIPLHHAGDHLRRRHLYHPWRDHPRSAGYLHQPGLGSVQPHA